MTFITQNDDETVALGKSFATFLKPGDVVALYGEMGSGKTTFVKGIAQGINSNNFVSSPTFTLINIYEGAPPIYHFDFYRVSTSNEAWELGCAEYFEGDGVCLIEWPERVSEILPESRMEFHFENRFSYGNLNQRQLTFRKT